MILRRINYSDRQGVVELARDVMRYARRLNRKERLKLWEIANDEKLVGLLMRLDQELRAAPFDWIHNELRDAVRLAWRYLDGRLSYCPMAIVRQVSRALDEALWQGAIE